MGTTQGETLVAKFLPRNGPSGWYSHDWISRADQLFTSRSATAEVATNRPELKMPVRIRSGNVLRAVTVSRLCPEA
jgi:hypothetical protein